MSEKIKSLSSLSDHRTKKGVEKLKVLKWIMNSKLSMGFVGRTYTYIVYGTQYMNLEYCLGRGGLLGHISTDHTKGLAHHVRSSWYAQ